MKSAWVGRVVCCLLAAMSVRVDADESLRGIACRSVHLAYGMQESTAFYNEVTIDQSAPGTYFMVCGWSKGYFGIQELGNGKKVVLFSVWDPGAQNDPSKVADENRVNVLHRDERVRVGRFGGEGTGGQSFYDFDWKPGQKYRFLVTARAVERRSEYSGYFHDPADGWKHLVTFSTPTGGTLLQGGYSFVEDFKRDRKSTQSTRKSRFGNGWFRTPDGAWHPIVRARFTADSNPVMNIDAGLDGGQFFLATGGEIQNAHVPLREWMELPAGERQLPTDLPELK